MDFATVLDRLSAAVETHDTPAFVELFTPDGVYDDYFFGRHQGRQAIGAMLDRFHVGGEAFCWQFTEPLAGPDLAYARYRFSYRSKEPESEGRLIGWDGMSRFRLSSGGLVADYAEVFDRGIAFASLGYAESRVAKLLTRYASATMAGEAMQAHLAHRGSHLGDG